LAVNGRVGALNVTLVSLDDWDESDRKSIREQVDRILRSGPFAAPHAVNAFWNTLSMKLSPAAAAG
jgi:hypothetical protein